MFGTKRKVGCVAIPLIVALLTPACGGYQPNGPVVVETVRSGSWEPILTEDQVNVVRKTLPRFEPEMFPPGANANGGLFTPQNFSPAFFLGPASPQGMRPTPKGIMLETNGFDSPEQPGLLPSEGTYFDRQRNAYEFSLGVVEAVPLHELENRMSTSLTFGAPVLRWDRRKARVDPGEVDDILTGVQRSLAIRLPQVADVDPRTCEVVIEPTIFWVPRSNFGDTWAGGLTEPILNGKFRLHIMAFYITGDRRVADWREFLVSEGINCFVMAIGRKDLAL